MTGSSSNGRKGDGSRGNSTVEIGSLLDLLNQQDEGMRSLFAKALNLYVSAGSDATPEKEKLDRLKQAIEESLQ